jgi:RNA polymerase sigma-70 factor (ECF subfamily)
MRPRFGFTVHATNRTIPSSFDAFDFNGDAAHMSFLLARVAEGSEAALGEGYDLTVDRILPLAVNVTRDRRAAEELVCAAYVHAWRLAGRFQDFEGTVIDWLLAICADMANAPS